ncbi:MAG TPA: reductive dehalogenase [Patescibacteria group bacterium]|nr:reductive dehalogenase [Patescibacteria group bacterium]
MRDITRERSFDENYPTLDSYRRYNQHGNTVRSSPTGYQTELGKEQRIKKGLPGFSLLDYAFRDAAYTANRSPVTLKGGRNTGYYSWSPLGFARKPEAMPRWTASPERASKVVTKAGRFYGAVRVGFCELDRRWIFSHTRDGRPIVFEEVEKAYEDDEKVVIPESHGWVVVMTVPMDYEETLYTPTAMVASSGMAYSRMHVLAGTMAEFIRGLGWNAIPSGNDTGLNVPIAIQAGLGHAGRMNRMITWERGPLVKICKVLTDLPLIPSPQAHDGILRYCEVCKKCAKNCPSGAIGEGPMGFEAPPGANPGVRRWYCDEIKCREFWDEVGTSCTICFRVCAFSKKPGLIHDAVKWFIRNVPQLNRLWVWSDDLLGYGRMADPKDYWD